MSNQSSIINHQSSIAASAPGSLMLLGEHAVLHGRRALVCAINKRISVCVSQCSESVIRIVSDLGNYEAPLDDLKDHPDFRFVLDAIRQYRLDPSFAKGYGGHGQGIELKIESEFSSDIGFGSSAAVTVATHAAMMEKRRRDALVACLARKETVEEASCLILAGSGNKAGGSVHSERDGGVASTFPEIFQRSLATIHRVQGRGSGADVAASVFGGVVAYRAEPLEIVPLKESFPLTAVYSGSKMKTADVIRLIEERRALNVAYFEKIFDRMDASVGEFVQAAEVERDLRARSERARSSRSTFLECLGREMILNQKLMEEMGLCNAALAEIIRLFGEQNIPAKISGSGLGDCAIGFGEFPAPEKFKTFSLWVESDGVLVQT